MPAIGVRVPAPQSVRRAVPALLLPGVLLALGGCGGGDGPGAPAGPTAAQVADRFARYTGVPLAVDRTSRSDSWTRLEQPDRLAIGAPRAYGAFSLYVVRRQRGLDVLLRGLTLDARRRGLRPLGPGFVAIQRFGGNVVLSAPVGERPEADADLERLAAAVGAAVSADPSRIAPDDRPCAQVGITPDSGRTGTCREDGVRRTIVAAGTELRSPVLAVRLTGVRVGRRSVRLTLRIRNTGDAALAAIRPRLRVEAETVEPDPAPAEGFPLAPGRSATVRVRFAVAGDVARAARVAGSVELPLRRAERGSPVLDERGDVGLIRLGG